jgi:DNA-binding XRE family transcriptional regulator
MGHPTENSPGTEAESGRRNPVEPPPDAEPSTAEPTMAARRRQLRQTQEETAIALEVSLSTYQRWERGEQAPRMSAQRRLAEYFAIPYEVLNRWFDIH